MADRIDTLTQTAASSSPTLTLPTQSAAGDAINIAGFGLGLYQKYQAQKTLQQQAESEAIFASDVAKGVAGLEEVQREIEANELTGVRANAKISKYLSQFSDPQMRLAVLSGTKQVSGTSALGSVSEAESQAQKEEQRMFELRSQASQLAPFTTVPMIDVEAASGEELQSFILNGQYHKSQFEAGRTRLMASREDQQYSETQLKKRGSFEYVTLARNGAVARAKEIMGAVDMTDPNARAEALQSIRGFQTNAPEQYQQYMKETYGVYVSATEAREATVNLTESLGNVAKVIDGTDVEEMSNRQIEQLTTDLILASNARDPELVSALLVSKRVGFPISGVTDAVRGVIMDVASNAPDTGVGGSMAEIERSMLAEGYDSKEIEKAKSVVRELLVSGSSAENNTPAVTEKLQDSLLADINAPSQRKLMQNVNNGTYTTRLKELANPDSAKTYAPVAEEVGESVERSTGLILEKLGTQWFAGRSEGGSDRTRGYNAGLPMSNFYSWDAAGKRFVPKGAGAPAGVKSVVGGINQVIQDTYKTYNNLGLDDKKLALDTTLTEIFGGADGN